MSSACAGCMKNLFWNTIPDIILHCQSEHRKYRGRWMMALGPCFRSCKAIFTCSVEIPYLLLMRNTIATLRRSSLINILFITNNLYQIFTYVKNRSYQFGEKENTVSGMLLYAKTEEEIQPDNVYQMHGSQISVKTLDLNLTFAEIASQMDRIWA